MAGSVRYVLEYRRPITTTTPCKSCTGGYWQDRGDAYYWIEHYGCTLETKPFHWDFFASFGYFADPVKRTLLLHKFRNDPYPETLGTQWRFTRITTEILDE